jgi:hypothetical protein
MNFGEVLSRAWNITWKYKVLWIFGLLASLAGGGSNLNTDYRMQGDQFPSQFGQNGGFENLPAWAIGLLLLAVLVMVVVFVLLGTLGRAGLARGAWLADSGEQRLGFNHLFAESRAYFSRVLVLGILSFAVGIGLLILIAIPTVLAAALTGGVAVLCFLPFLCVLIPVFLALSLIFDLGTIAITGENLGVMDGLRRGWEVFRANLGVMIALAVVLWIAGAVVNFIVALPMLAVMTPLIAGVMLGGGWGELATGSLVVTVILFLLYLPVLLAVKAVLTTYVTTSWTLAFRRLTGRAESSAAIIDVPAQPVG